MPHGPAHRLGGGMGQISPFRQFFRNFAVGPGFPIGDFQQKIPHILPELGTRRVQGRQKIRFFPEKINIQPVFCLGQYGRFRLPAFLRKALGEIFLPFKPKPRQASLIGGKQNISQRRSIMSGKNHVFPPFFGL